MVIKRCTLAEIDALQSVCRKTFMETFEEQNTKEDMEKLLIKCVKEAEILIVNRPLFLSQ